MAGQSDRYYLRRKSGNTLGPFSELVIITMLEQGKLEGNEEISRDKSAWLPVSTLASPPPSPGSELPTLEEPDFGAPASEGGQGTEILSNMAPIRLTAFSPEAGADDAGKEGSFDDGGLDLFDAAPPRSAAGASPGAPGSSASSWGERDLGSLEDPGAGLSLERDGSAGVPAEEREAAPAESSGPPGLAPLELGGLDLQPLELLQPTPERPPAAIRLESLHALTARSPADADDDGVPAALSEGDELLGSAPLIMPDAAHAMGHRITSLLGDGGKDAKEGSGGAGAKSTSPAPVLPARSRTMTAAKPRVAAQRRRPGWKLVLALSGAVAILGGAAAFMLFDLRSLLVGEPAVAKVLGATADEIGRDEYPAYQRGADLLMEEAATRTKSIRLRAAAAELLARSVVIRRGERSRIGKAENLLSEVPAPTADTSELRRARAWLAAAKGKWSEAQRLVAEETSADKSPSSSEGKAGGGNAGEGDALLLKGWVELGRGKPSAAAATFKKAAAAAPHLAAARFGLATAEERAGLPGSAAASYKAVLGLTNRHFGAALGLTRVGHYPPAARLTLVRTLLSNPAATGSRTELAEAQVLAGRTARALGKHAEAETAFKKALAADASSPAAQVALGETLLAEGRLHEAVTRFRQAAPMAPVPPVGAGSRDLTLAMAAVLIERGNLEQGLALLDEVAPAARAPAAREPAATTPAGAAPPSGAPLDPRAPFWRGRAAELKRPADLDAASARYHEALKADPGFVPATLQLATVLIQQRRGAEALATLKRAEAAGANAVALKVALGEALLVSNHLDRARKTFKEVLASHPKLAAARLGLASTLEAGGNLPAARAELEAVLASDPAAPGVRQRVAGVLVALGKRPEALAMLESEIAAGKASASTTLEAARLALEIGKRELARALAEKVVTEDPQTPGALLLLGRAKHASGDVPGALADYRRALTFGSSPELHYEYARALAQAGKEEEALSEYEQAADLPQARVERGRILLLRGDADRAVASLEPATRQGAGSADAWLLLGNGYDRLGKQGKAEVAWRSAVKADPRAPEPLYRLGRLEMDQGKAGAALGHLRKAAPVLPKSAPWIADFYFQLGFAEKARGTRPGALAAFRSYLATASSDAPSRHEVEKLVSSLGP
jgi:tetratricopeptide (TPR) repeat protein